MICSDTVESVCELKEDPSANVRSGADFPVVVSNKNQSEFSDMPDETDEKMQEDIDDLELIRLVKERKDEPLVEIGLDRY